MKHSSGAAAATGPVSAPVWAVALTVLAAALAAVAAGWWLARAVRRTAHRADAGCHVLMSLGMGAMLLAMV